jgi:hypothetical protein
VIRYLLAAAAAALCLAASTSARTTVHYDYWRYTLTGVQVLHWTVTSHFDRTDGDGTCDITHHGDQTFRFGTGGAIRVRLRRGSSGVPVEVRKGRKWRGLVPIVGTEERVHTVISAPGDLSVCSQPSNVQADATPCSVTEALAKGAVEKTNAVKNPPVVTMYDPLAYAFQPAFPTCHAQGFDLKQFFWSVLFTRGAELKLHGGTLYRRHAKLRGSFATGLICIADWADIPRFVRCSDPHNATVETSWRMTFRR